MTRQEALDLLTDFELAVIQAVKEENNRKGGASQKTEKTLREARERILDVLTNKGGQ